MVRSHLSATRLEPCSLRLYRLRVLGRDLVIVIRTVRPVLALPEEIKYPHLTFFAASGVVGTHRSVAEVEAQLASEVIYAAERTVDLRIFARISVGIVVNSLFSRKSHRISSVAGGTAAAAQDHRRHERGKYPGAGAGPRGPSSAFHVGSRTFLIYYFFKRKPYSFPLRVRTRHDRRQACHSVRQADIRAR